MSDIVLCYLYILHCADDSYYIGCGKNLNVRLKEHSLGRASNYTAARLPVRLVFFEEHQSLGEAKIREHQLKRWSRAKKMALIEGDKDRLLNLSKSGNINNIGR